jgi:serine/threonine-protein kinase
VSVDPRIGSELFGYRLEALLGRGGMSVVYRAHDLALDRKVALKLLAPELAEDERFRARFLKESRMAASLDHPNVIPIYEAGESGGLLCIAMRYVEGTDLKSLLRREGAIDPEQALAYCAQVAAALDAAHALGLVHRDVKPSNVLIARGGHCYLADFGLTQDTADRSDLTLTGQLLGSVDYAAPEQIEGKSVDGRADVYSLGCLLYECLTGSVPFPKDSELAVLWAHVHEPPPNLDSHAALEPVLTQALAKRPADRYGTCSELVEAARGALPSPEPESRRSNRLLVVLAALVLAGGLAAGLALALGGGSSRPKPDLTVRNNTLVRIDPNTNKIAAVITVGVGSVVSGTGPGDLAAGGNTIWVYNWLDHTVRAVDPRTNTVERIIAIGGFAPTTGNSIAADTRGAWVLSATGGSGVLTRVRPGVAVPRAFAFGYEPLSVAVGPGAVWVAAKSATKEAVLRISPSTGTVLATVPLHGADIQSIAVGDGAVWALQGGAITRIDPATARITGTAALPAQDVAQIAVGDGGVWATMRPPNGGNVLVRIDPHTLRVTTTIPAPSSQGSASLTHLVLGDGALWWSGTDSGTIWRVDPKTGKIVATIHITPPASTFDAIGPLQITAGADAIWVTVTVSP